MHTKRVLHVLWLTSLVVACSNEKPPAAPPVQNEPEAVERPAEPTSEQPSGTNERNEPAPTEAGAESGKAETATIVLKPTQGNQVSGELKAKREPSGVRLQGTLTGFPAQGAHGFHVHEKGDCSAPDAKSAGEHFNPQASVHGKEAAAQHHLGDIDNLTADSSGKASVDVVIPNVTLGDGSSTDIMGKSVIVHAAPDDYKTQPSGGSGARIACGVITKS